MLVPGRTSKADRYVQYRKCRGEDGRVGPLDHEDN